MDERKKKIYIKITIIIVVISVLLGIIGFYFNNKNSVKKVKNEDYIYEEDIPIINIRGNIYNEINTSIEDLYDSVDDETMFVNSEIYKNNAIYSLVIKNDNYSFEEETFLTSYIIYNLDVNSGKILEKEELMKEYGYTKDEIVSSAKKLLQKYYEDESNEGYVEKNECNLDCYISFVRGIDDIYDNIKLFVEDNILKGYITFSTNSLLSDGEYFSENNNSSIYKFEISH